MEKKVWSGRQRSATARKAASPEAHLIKSINAAQAASSEPATADKRAVLHMAVPTASPAREPELRKDPEEHPGETR
jgi:hypothetical protein